MGNNNGLSAFPRPYSYAEDVDEVHVAQKGMTLRDYFAAKAMQAIIASDGTYEYKNRAIEAYQAADAMLEARK